MNSQTKIVVIPMKELIIGAVIAVIIIVAAIFAIFTLNSSSTKSTAASPNSSYSTKKSYNSSAANVSSNAVSSALDNSDISENAVNNDANTNTSNTYTPGVYTSSISLNGNAVDIQVTVDKNNINSIEMNNLSDSITTMYPMLKTSFDELSAEVIAKGSTENISYSADNKYTSTMLLNAIQNALNKCTVR